jgi:hypothetical protein
MEKIHLTAQFDNKYTGAKSISIDCNKQLHPNLISKLILRFALLLTKNVVHNIKILIPYPGRLSS